MLLVGWKRGAALKSVVAMTEETSDPS